jgi:mannose-6-phosphate isomerase-like protein (cupin superfamily)
VERISEAQMEYRGIDCGVKYLFRGPHTDWGVILLKPGQWLGAHYHHHVEETFFFLEGSAKVYVDEEEHPATAGDGFRLVAPERHDIHNDTTEDVKMIFIKYPYLPDDKVVC